MRFESLALKMCDRQPFLTGLYLRDIPAAQDGLLESFPCHDSIESRERDEITLPRNSSCALVQTTVDKANCVAATHKNLEQ